MAFGWIGGPKLTNALKTILQDSATVDFTISGNTVYADSVMTKEPVVAVAENAILFSGLQTIDGYATQEGDRVLVAGQADASQNGIYIASSGAWVRSEDFNSGENIKSKINVPVVNGDRYNDTTWQLDIDISNVVVGTTLFPFRIESYKEQNGKELPIEFGNWISSGGRYYQDIAHFLNSERPDVSVFETIAGEDTAVTMDEVDYLDADHVRLWIIDLGPAPNPETRFDGYILVEPAR